MENLSFDGSYIANESVNNNYGKRKAEDDENDSSKKIKHDIEDHVCSVCQASFANCSNLRHHVESYHIKSNSWSCTQCGKVCSFFLLLLISPINYYYFFLAVLKQIKFKSSFTCSYSNSTVPL